VAAQINQAGISIKVLYQNSSCPY